jgi:HK97 family phage portal protein
MRLLPRIRKRAATITPEDVAGLFPPYLFGLPERVGAVSRCLQLTSQQIAGMPLRFRGGFEPLWVSTPDPVWYPNGVSDALFALVWSIYSRGDGFLWVTSRYATGYPQTWTVLDPDQVTVDADPRGGRLYSVGGLDLQPDDVLQITRNPNGALRGSSALAAYAGNVKSAAAAEALAADVYKGGGIPWAILQPPTRRLDREQAEDLQRQWLARVGQRNGAPAVIPSDIAFTLTTPTSPKDLALLETREWDAKQIAAAFGVPAFLLNMDQAGGLNYSNPEMLFDMWWKSELMPRASGIGNALSTWLPRGSWVEFDPSVLLAPDMAAKQGVWSKALADGVVTQDEYRAAVFDLPPLVEGEAVDLIDEPHGSAGSLADPGTEERETPTPPGLGDGGYGGTSIDWGGIVPSLEVAANGRA